MQTAERLTWHQSDDGWMTSLFFWYRNGRHNCCLLSAVRLKDAQRGDFSVGVCLLVLNVAPVGLWGQLRFLLLGVIGHFVLHELCAHVETHTRKPHLLLHRSELWQLHVTRHQTEQGAKTNKMTNNQTKIKSKMSFRIDLELAVTSRDLQPWERKKAHQRRSNARPHLLQGWLIKSG